MKSQLDCDEKQIVVTEEATECRRLARGPDVVAEEQGSMSKGCAGRHGEY